MTLVILYDVFETICGTKNPFGRLVIVLVVMDVKNVFFKTSLQTFFLSNFSILNVKKRF